MGESGTKERLMSRFFVLAFCVCAAMAASVVGQRPAGADGDSWADVSDVTQYVPLAFAVGHTLYRADHQGAFQMATAGALTVGSSELLKRAIDKKRPDYEPGDRERAFPSGHVAKAWFAAAHLQRRYGCYELEWHCWRASTAPYLAAVATAAGRVRAKRHHLEDVLGSAVLAEMFVWLTTDRFDGDVVVAPAIGDGLGIAIIGEF